MLSSWLRVGPVTVEGESERPLEIQCQAHTLNQDSGYEFPVICHDILSCDSHHLKSCDEMNKLHHLLKIP